MVRATAGTASLNVTTTVMNLVITLALTHLLGSLGYGVFAFATAVAAVLVSPATLGLTSIVLRNASKYRVNEQWELLRGLLIRANQAVLAASALLAVVALAVGPWVSNRQPEEAKAYAIALLLVPIVALSALRQAALQAFDRVVVGRVPEGLIQPSVFLLLVMDAEVVLDVTGAEAVALYVAASGLSLVVGMVLLVRALPTAVRRCRAQFETRLWARSVLPLILVGAIPTLTAEIDVILLGTIKGPHSAGIFNVADRTSLFVGFFLVAVTYPLGPRVARLWASGARDELQRVVTRSTNAVFAVSAAVAAVLIVFAHQILALFGQDFVAGDSALRILCLGQLVNTGTGTVGLVLIMTGHEKNAARSVGVGALIGATLNVLFVPLFGLVGAAVATSLGVATTNLLLLRQLWVRTGIWAGVSRRRHVHSRSEFEDSDHD
jgi:O-antigen/teichoic acid export membrane protein